MGDRGGLGERDGRLVPVVDLAAVLAAPKAVLEFAYRRFQRRVEAVGAAFAARNGSSAPGRDLDVLAVLALPAIAFVVEFDVEQVDGAVEALEASQLLGDIGSEVIGNFDVAALDDDLGVGPSCDSSSAPTIVDWLVSMDCIDILGNSLPLRRCTR